MKMNEDYELKIGAKKFQLTLLQSNEFEILLKNEYNITLQDKVAFVDYYLQKIFVRSDVHQDLIAESILHEFLHVVLDDAGTSVLTASKYVDLNEKFVTIFSPRLLAALRDNSIFLKKFNIT